MTKFSSEIPLRKKKASGRLVSGTPERRPPGPRTSAWVNVLRYLRDPLGFWTALGHTYGDVAYVRLGPYDCYLVNSPALIKDVLVGENRKLVKPRVYEEGKRAFGNGLVTSEGELHRRQRRLIQPLFAGDRVVTYADLMVEAAVHTRERWQAGAVVGVFEEMSRLTLAVAGESLLAEDVGPETAALVRELASSSAVLHRFLLPFSGVLWRLPLPTTRRFERTRGEVDRAIYRLIAKRRDSAASGQDLLSLLLAAQDAEGEGESVSDRQVRDEAITILLAGHETAALGMTWTWYLLSEHPATEAKLHRELDEVLGMRLPGVEDAERLPYTQMVLREAMRLFPPAWAIARCVDTEVHLGRYRVPRGSILFLSQWVTHRDARFFTDPLDFRPERWDPEVSEAPLEYAYFPFGGGPRRCIGERFAWTETVLALATLAQRWQLRLVPGQLPKPKAIATLRPQEEIAMAVRPRR